MRKQAEMNTIKSCRRKQKFVEKWNDQSKTEMRLGDESAVDVDDVVVIDQFELTIIDRIK